MDTKNALVVATPGAMAAPAAQKPTFTEMIAMGNQLVQTGFLPQHIKNGVQAAAIMLKGEELGMPPMRALASLYFIKGKVSEASDSQLARFKSAGGHARFVTLTNEKAELWLKHPNGDEHTEVFTIEDARRAGLFSNSKYTETPKAMLRSRAITAGLKSIGWDGAVATYDFDAEAEVVPPAAPEQRQGVLPPPPPPAPVKLTAVPPPVDDTTHTENGEVVPKDEPDYAAMTTEQKIAYWRTAAEAVPDREALARVAAALKGVEPAGSEVFVAFQKAYNAAYARTKPVEGGGA